MSKINLSDKKNASDTKENLKKKMQNSNSMFEQVDYQKITNDNKNKLAAIKDDFNNIDDKDHSTTQEKFSSILLIVKKLFDIASEENELVGQISKQNQELINKDKKQQFEEESLDDDKPLSQQLSELKKEVNGMKKFFNSADPTVLAELIDNLQSYKNDGDMMLLSGIHSLLGENATPKQIENLLSSIKEAHNSGKIHRKDESANNSSNSTTPQDKDDSKSKDKDDSKSKDKDDSNKMDDTFMQNDSSEDEQKD
ncbi:hypothetical protein [Apilactobacillus timberlakei]|uniref:hypothetical protein n=1 Tax=Apilactobacillus timberlakei TaxID=2008380 RepID=UPI001127822C|nr:hypothetical protein [Apilactobacillus timberlakei]TPR16727.1 hypothetical protein DYZ95_07035 [Apilactobacillus timberlakei]TPR21589.1 hypothetical protein DY083_06085 [Apilactobacillus timberlakei]